MPAMMRRGDSEVEFGESQRVRFPDLSHAVDNVQGVSCQVEAVRGDVIEITDTC